MSEEFTVSVDMSEVWKPVVGYEGLYEVSNLGRVKSIKRNGTKGGILKLKCRNGYSAVDLCKDDKKKTIDVHRLVAQAFIPNPQEHKCINHKDENRKNNHFENLEWCTVKYNANYGTAIARRVETQCKNHRKFVCKETGRVYLSQAEFSRDSGLSPGFVNNILHGRRGANNYHLEFIE